MIFKILKERETWILGTGLFLGYCIGIIIGNIINFKPDSPVSLILGVILYLDSVMLVALIKLLDRLAIASNTDLETEE